MFSPTSVTAFDKIFVGNGDVWLADGYGKNLLHRYDSEVNHILSIDVSKGVGRFECAHSLGIDTRFGNTELPVADWASDRVQIFDMEVDYICSIGAYYFDRRTVSFYYG